MLCFWNWEGRRRLQGQAACQSAGNTVQKERGGNAVGNTLHEAEPGDPRTDRPIPDRKPEEVGGKRVRALTETQRATQSVEKAGDDSQEPDGTEQYFQVQSDSCVHPESGEFPPWMLLP